MAPANHHLCLLDRERTPKVLIKHQLFVGKVGSGTRLAMAAYFGALYHQATCTQIVLDTNENIKQSTLAGIGISLSSVTTREFKLKHGLLKTFLVKGSPLDRLWRISTGQH